LGLNELIEKRECLISLTKSSEDQSSAAAVRSLIYSFDDKPGFANTTDSWGFFTEADLERRFVAADDDAKEVEVVTYYQCGKREFYVNAEYNC
jgi:hypothetical protein